jgi:hypothetical protein
MVLAESGGFIRQFLVDDKGCVLIACWGVPTASHPVRVRVRVRIRTRVEIRVRVKKRVTKRVKIRVRVMIRDVY